MKGRIGREQLGLIFGLPVLILVIFGAWVIWRQTADLDPIEARQLDWSALRKLGWEHIKVTFVATFFVLATALPIGVALTRPKLRRFSGPVVAFANAGQATPVIGLIVLLALWIGFTFWVAVLALAIYAFLPVLRNTIVGLQQVDPTLVEAARGMGMSQMKTLATVELPLAAPVIMAGVRTALVLLVGTASFATFINAGGLGALIQAGINLFRYPILVSGAILIALLALVFEWAGRVLEAIVTPKGL
ncbi:ABC transporter permease [Dermacoccus abyssi]|uniref:ABC transporter permease n=1 Tax=Dermacoccus abyssi TaxID=322596 RepID=A0ABX5ZCN2_9MICO|nr:MULTISPECIES: ABC transporter permease [Dermacoccus]MCT1985797.1 ABC transporter permease [Dermacoccus abyssi]KLO64047.1 ABC transporter permease [Dermacoccus sp. PE3]MBE7372289.1 ABC transporter permease [Dermacoccus barathri]QEH94355.1 ABC transporter permease [Dermacoccus abyssi]QNK53531.1 ABC transporter permease [Dermacoccus sp. PAMC28757]